MKLVLAFVASAGLAVALFYLRKEITASGPDLDPERLGHVKTASAAADLLSQWHPVTSQHVRYLLVDYGLLLSYGSLLWLLGSAAADAFDRSEWKNAALFALAAGWIGVAAALADAVENALRLRMISMGPQRMRSEPDLLPFIASVATTAKWWCLGAAAASLALLWLVLLVAARQTR